MSIAMILKIFSDCCICFAILSSGPVQFAIPLLLPALICGISAGIATFFYEKGWRLLCFICGFLPFLSLLLADGSSQALLVAIPAIYTAFVIFRRKLELEYYSYNQFFTRSLLLLGISYLVVNVFIFLSVASGDGAPPMDAEVILRYGFVHTLCGIVLQRQLRLGMESDSTNNRRQLTSLLGVAATIVIGFLVAEPLLRQQLLGIVKMVLFLFGVPVMAVIQIASWLIEWFFQSDNQLPQGIAKPTGAAPSFTLPAVSMPGGTGAPEEEKAEAVPVDPILLWGLLVAVLLLIAGVLLYKSFQKRKSFGEVGKIRLSAVDTPKKKRPLVLSNRHKVRQLYREFLRTENGWGLKLKKNDTSADVLGRIHPDTDKESAAALRQVYLSARYDDRQNISREQVNAAKQALKGTKNRKK